MKGQGQNYTGCLFLLCLNNEWGLRLLKEHARVSFSGTNFINVRLMQRVFSVWPVAQPVVGEMEMHSVANFATLQTPLATFFP